MHATYPNLRNDAIDDAILRIETQRRAVGIELLGAILSDPSSGAPMAEASGVFPHNFPDDDMKIIAAAADVARDRDKLFVLRLARAALDQSHLWDITDHRCWLRECIWCPESLVSLACSYPGPAAVPHLAQTLSKLNRRIDLAEHHFRSAFRFIEDPQSLEMEAV